MRGPCVPKLNRTPDHLFLPFFRPVLARLPQPGLTQPPVLSMLLCRGGQWISLSIKAYRSVAVPAVGG